MYTEKPLEVRDEKVHEKTKWNEIFYYVKLKKACN